MSLSINTNGISQHQQHSMIKIYYLKNHNQQNNLQTQSIIQHKQQITKTYKNKPSLSYLSSLIQHDKNMSFLDDQIFIQKGGLPNYGQGSNNNIGKYKKNKNSHQKNLKLQQLISAQTQQQTNKKTHHRKAFTQEINNNNNQLSNIEDANAKLTTKSHHKRVTKTSQQQTFPIHKKENNQALSKDFLCNIVKEWGHFTQGEEIISKRAKLKRWKASIDYNYNHKISSYKPQQMEELRKNKSLMKEHFNMFIQNQKNKKQGSKQKSLSKLKAVFNTDHNYRSISNRQYDINNTNNNNKSIPLMAMNNHRFSHHQSISRDIYIRDSTPNLNDEERIIRRRKTSIKQKSEKKEYLRLMYGPQVKLIPKLFQESGKGRNFNWTKLDKDIFDSRKKVRNM